MATDPEVPEADALEQSQDLEPGSEAGMAVPERAPAFEVPEADALEQSQDVPTDEEERR